MKREFKYYIDHKLKHKLDLLTKNLDKRDVWILVSGDEGSGKTNTAAYLLEYFSCKTGRPLKIENFYFDSEDLFNKAKSSKSQLLNWDEAALGGLSTEWQNKSQINLIKLSITCRKLHHVFIMCIPRFWKLKDDLKIDRVHAQIHMNLGKRGNNEGHYMYLTRRGIKFLNRIYKSKKIALYGKAMRKHGGFGGSLPYVFDKVFSKEQQQFYENRKDKAISDIGKNRTSKDKKDLKDLKYKISQVQLPIKTKKDLAIKIGINPNSLTNWSKLKDLD